jgi:hypothetical protein
VNDALRDRLLTAAAPPSGPLDVDLLWERGRRRRRIRRAGLGGGTALAAVLVVALSTAVLPRLAPSTDLRPGAGGGQPTAPTAAASGPFAPPTFAPSESPEHTVPAGEPLTAVPMAPEIDVAEWLEYLPEVDPPPDPGIQVEPAGSLVLFPGPQGVPGEPLRAALEEAGVDVAIFEVPVPANAVGNVVALTDDPEERQSWEEYGVGGALHWNQRILPDRIGGTLWLAMGVATPPGERYRYVTGESPYAAGEVLGGVHCALGEPEEPVTAARLDEVAGRLGLTIEWRALTLDDVPPATTVFPGPTSSPSEMPGRVETSWPPVDQRPDGAVQSVYEEGNGLLSVEVIPAGTPEVRYDVEDGSSSRGPGAYLPNRQADHLPCTPELTEEGLRRAQGVG